MRKKGTVFGMAQRQYLFQDAKIAQDSVFDIEELYKVLFRWFENNGYEFYEKEYIDADEPRGKHIEFFWTAEKDADAYLRYGIDVNVNVSGLKPVEIDKGGMKVKSSSASMTIRISAYAIKDPKNSWSDSGKLMRLVYEKVLIAKRLATQLQSFEREVGLLVNEMRSFLSMHRL